MRGPGGVVVSGFLHRPVLEAADQFVHRAGEGPNFPLQLGESLVRLAVGLLAPGLASVARRYPEQFA